MAWLVTIRLVGFVHGVHERLLKRLGWKSRPSCWRSDRLNVGLEPLRSEIQYESPGCGGERVVFGTLRQSGPDGIHIDVFAVLSEVVRAANSMIGEAWLPDWKARFQSK